MARKILLDSVVLIVLFSKVNFVNSQTTLEIIPDTLIVNNVYPTINLRLTSNNKNFVKEFKNSVLKGGSAALRYDYDENEICSYKNILFELISNQNGEKVIAGYNSLNLCYFKAKSVFFNKEYESVYNFYVKLCLVDYVLKNEIYAFKFKYSNGNTCIESNSIALKIDIPN